MALKEKLAEEVDNRLRENLNVGWISPEGDFYGCDSGGHTNILVKALKLPASANVAEWVLVGSAECKERECHWMNFGVLCGYDEVLTDQQKETLSSLGFNSANPYAKRNCQIEFRDVFPDGYQNHVIPYAVEQQTSPHVAQQCSLEVKRC